MATRDLITDRKDEPGHENFVGFEIYPVTVIHTQPEPFFETSYERSDLAPAQPQTYRVAYWYWEFDSIPDAWVETAQDVDEVWAATEFVAKGLRDKLSVPVRTLFPGVRLAPYEPRGKAYFNLPEDETTYVFVFHMMSIMERKNPLGLIRAFKQAFRPEDAARLVLKTSFGDRHPDQIKALREAAEGARITIIDDEFVYPDVLALIDACDVYVSLHRSEGLGLTMAEAMLMGKPVVATGYSGNMEFMDDTNSLLVEHDIVPLGQEIPPYSAENLWAAPSEQDAAEKLRRPFDDPAFARELGAKAQADVQRMGNPRRAGEQILSRLAEIEASLPGSRGRH